MDHRHRRILLASCNLSGAELERLYADFLSLNDQQYADWVQDRHRELQRQGLDNETIYRQIARELPQRRFAAPPLSLRQIRRIIYG